MDEKKKILEVKDLRVSFRTNEGIVKAVRGVSFDLYDGETLAIVGESGSGKSVSSRTIMGILAGNAIIEEGSILYRGQDLIKLKESQFHEIRGNQIGMIFQDPTSSLNPIMKVGKQITEGMIINGKRKINKYKALFHDENQLYENLVSSIKEVKTYYYFNLKKKKKIKRLKLDKKQIKNNLSLAKDEKNNLLQDIIENLAAVKGSSTTLTKSDRRAKLGVLKADLKVARKNLRLKRKEAKVIITQEYQGYKDAYVQECQAASEKIEKIKSEHLHQDLRSADLSKKEIELQEILAAKTQLVEQNTALRTFYVSRNCTVSNEEKNRTLLIQKQQIDEIDKQLKNARKEYKKLVKENDPDLIAAKKELADIKENYRRKIKVTLKEANEEALKIMNEVGIPEPEKRLNMYPFQFSGGMKQRIVIAIALTSTPEILICDEPTTALDVTIQAQILELLKTIKTQRKLSLIFITHNLGVVANMADRVAVMYAGKIVEYGLSEDIFYNAKHPYTWALLSSMPDLNSSDKLLTIPGTPPNMLYPPKGDAFAQRNKYALKIDFLEEPPSFKISDTHYAATWLLDPRSPKVSQPEVITNRIAEIKKTIELLKKVQANSLATSQLETPPVVTKKQKSSKSGPLKSEPKPSSGLDNPDIVMDTLHKYGKKRVK
jgi:oligopeptide transport system ATP-binding protein